MGVIIPEGFGIAKLRWKPLTSPDEVITTFGFLHDPLVSAEDEAGAIRTIAIATNRPLNPARYSTRYQSVGVEVTVMTGTGPVTGESVAFVTGTGTGTPLTTNTAVLLKKITARGGRKGRGRMFIPGIGVSEIDVDEVGIIASGDVSALQGVWGGFFDDLSASPTLPVLLHSDGGPPDSITSVQIQPIVATQRRRLRR